MTGINWEIWSLHEYRAVSPRTRISLGTRGVEKEWPTSNTSLLFLVPMSFFSKKERFLGGSTGCRVDMATCSCCLLLRNQTKTVNNGLAAVSSRRKSWALPYTLQKGGYKGEVTSLGLATRGSGVCRVMEGVWFPRRPRAEAQVQRCDWRYHWVSWTSGGTWKGLKVRVWTAFGFRIGESVGMKAELMMTAGKEDLDL